MRRWTPLLVTGLLLIGLGGGTGALVGPDDTIRIGTHTVPFTAAGQAVTTHPEVTAFRDVGLQVEASAPGGVFLATSRRIDTESLLKGTERYEIGRVAWGTVGGHPRPDGPAATFDRLAPTQILGWNSLSPDLTRLDDGAVDTDLPERAHLVVELDGTPVDVVIVPRDPEARVTLSLGAHVNNLFLLQIAVAWTGALMVALWWLLRLRRRRRERSDAESPAPPGAADSAGDRDAPAGTGSRWNSTTLPQHPTAGPPRLENRSDRDAAPIQAVQQPARQPTQQLPQQMTQGAPTRRLPHAITLPILAVLLISLAASGCTSPSAVPVDTTPTGSPSLTLADAALVADGEPQAVHSPTFTSYPVWAVVQLPPKDGKGVARLQLLTRSAFRQPWQAAGTVRVAVAPPAPVSTPVPASQVVQRAAGEAAAEVAAYWSRGSTGQLQIGKSTKKARRTLLDSGISADQIWVTDHADGAVHVVHVDGGHLVLVRQEATTPRKDGTGTKVRRLTSAVFLASGQVPVLLGSTLKPAD